jgi:hypothetical protein
MRTSTTATATHQQTDSAILRDSNAYHPTRAKPCTFSKTLKQEEKKLQEPVNSKSKKIHKQTNKRREKKQNKNEALRSLICRKKQQQKRKGLRML